MTYSCADFFDDITSALKLEDPDDDGFGDNVSEMGNLALAEIDRLQQIDKVHPPMRDMLIELLASIKGIDSRTAEDVEATSDKIIAQFNLARDVEESIRF